MHGNGYICPGKSSGSIMGGCCFHNLFSSRQCHALEWRQLLVSRSFLLQGLQLSMLQLAVHAASGNLISSV